MSEITAIMTIERITKRKYRFLESDEKGNPVDFAKQKLGTLYLRHDMFDSKPELIKVTVTAEPLET